MLWMFDPLTANPAAAMHHHKAALFNALAPHLHGVMAMDASIAHYVAENFPALACCHLPYLVADKHIHPPLPDAARQRDVLMLGGDTPRRRQAERLFAGHTARPMQAEFVWGGLWGQARDTCRAASRICLNLHADAEHTYFDQFRTFESWATGTPVVSENFDGHEAFGIMPGMHLLAGELDALPGLCADLLADAPRRQTIALAAQALLRERFSVEAWRSELLAMVEDLG